MTSQTKMSLGEFLRNERERRGITIEQVASATKIGVRTLHSLEEDHYSELPAKPFIRGFVTAYCRFIGLDPKDVLDCFEAYISRKANERPNREAGHSGYAFERKDGLQQGRTILLMAIFGFILLGGLAMIFLKPSLRHARRSHMDKLRDAQTLKKGSTPVPAQVGAVVPSSLPSVTPSVSVLQTSDPISSPNIAPSIVPSIIPSIIPSMSPSIASNLVPTSTSSPSPISIPTQKPESEPSPQVPGMNPLDPLDSGHSLKKNEIEHKVVFKTLADIWVRYQVDDRPIRKFLIREGKSLYLRAKNRIQVQVSNPNSVSFSYNDGGFTVLSKSENTVLTHGNTTLFYPNELSEKIEKPFGNQKPLPKTSDPEVDENSQLNDTEL